MNKFFVYGTLQTGCSNHRVIPQESIEKVEAAEINGMDLYSYRSGSFPCMIEGKRKVLGQVITIKKKYLKQALKMMDRLEGYVGPHDEDNFYDRVRRPVTLSDGSKVEANVYLYNILNGGLGEPIEDGNFRTYIENKSWRNLI